MKWILDQRILEVLKRKVPKITVVENILRREITYRLHLRSGEVGEIGVPETTFVDASSAAMHFWKGLNLYQRAAVVLLNGFLVWNNAIKDERLKGVFKRIVGLADNIVGIMEAEDGKEVRAVDKETSEDDGPEREGCLSGPDVVGESVRMGKGADRINRLLRVDMLELVAYELQNQNNRARL